MKTRDFNPFNRVRIQTPSSNKFELSFDNKLSFDMGNLYPVMNQKCIPSDYYEITPQALVRFAPMIFPVMQRFDVYLHFFYTPCRVLWENHPYYLAGENYAKPYIQGTDAEPLPVTAGSYFDYMNLPLTDNCKEKIDAAPFFAYQRIFNEYFQDQNNDPLYETLRDSLKAATKLNGRITPAQLLPGSTHYADNPIFPRAWEHDYFTSNLQFAQKGAPVNIPLEIANFTAPVAVGNAEDPTTHDPYTGDIVATAGVITDPLFTQLVSLTGQASIDGSDIALTGTINQLRAAIQLQKFLEINARSGTRYNELIRAHFNQDIGDARINRPEYIGCIQNNVVISEVLQTSQSNDDSALGDYAGHGSALVGGNTLRFKCPEHGWITCVMSVLPKTAYFQGIPRKYSQFSYLDEMWPNMAHIGEQATLNKEVYYDNTLTTMNDTWGYLPRYSEYKYNPSEVHGDFRTTLKDWGLWREFSSLPALDEQFIYAGSDPTQLKRIFAVQDPDVNSLYAHIWFDLKSDRPIPFYTDPAGLA